jgi:hypothetical protein
MRETLRKLLDAIQAGRETEAAALAAELARSMR